MKKNLNIELLETLLLGRVSILTITQRPCQGAQYAVFLKTKSSTASSSRVITI